MKIDKSMVGRLAAVSTTQNPAWFVTNKFFSSEDSVYGHYGARFNNVKVIWPYGEVVEVDCE